MAQFISKDELIDLIVTEIRKNICDALFPDANKAKTYKILLEKKSKQASSVNNKIFPFTVSINERKTFFLITDTKQSNYIGIQRIVVSFQRNGKANLESPIPKSNNDVTTAKIYYDKQKTYLNISWSLAHKDGRKKSERNTSETREIKIETIDSLMLQIPDKKHDKLDTIEKNVGYKEFYKYKGEPTIGSFSYGSIMQDDFYFSTPLAEDDPFESDISVIDEYRAEAAHFSRWLVYTYGSHVRGSELLRLLHDKQDSSRNICDSCGTRTKSEREEEDYYRLKRRYEEFGSIDNRLITKRFVGVYSSALTNKNILLWSNYANSHKGVCIEYSFQDLFNSIQSQREIKLVVYGKVKYSKTLPLGADNMLSFGPYLDDEMLTWILEIETVFTKFTDWRYQEEYRFSVFSDNWPNKSGLTIKVKPRGFYVGCNSDCSWASLVKRDGVINKGKMKKNNNRYVMEDPFTNCVK